MIALILASFAPVAPAGGQDTDWTAVTVARDGSWGIGNNGFQSQAIAAANRGCRKMSVSGSDCGATMTTTRGGWILAFMCGDYPILVTANTIEEARKVALYRAIDLELFYVNDLAPCHPVLTVGPDGAVVGPDTLDKIN